MPMVLEIPTKAEWHWGRTSKLSRHLQLLTIGEFVFFVFHLSKHNATPCSHLSLLEQSQLYGME